MFPSYCLLLTPQTTFPRGSAREMAAAAACQELHPGDKRNERNVLARLASLSSQGYGQHLSSSCNSMSPVATGKLNCALIFIHTPTACPSEVPEPPCMG
ncbi:unnamed protein product, partial [Rangifer tarandus platyrhynchus]